MREGQKWKFSPSRGVPPQSHHLSYTCSPGLGHIVIPVVVATTQHGSALQTGPWPGLLLLCCAQPAPYLRRFHFPEYNARCLTLPPHHLYTSLSLSLEAVAISECSQQCDVVPVSWGAACGTAMGVQVLAVTLLPVCCVSRFLFSTGLLMGMGRDCIKAY